MFLFLLIRRYPLNAAVALAELCTCRVSPGSKGAKYTTFDKAAFKVDEACNFLLASSLSGLVPCCHFRVEVQHAKATSGGKRAKVKATAVEVTFGDDVIRMEQGGAVYVSAL